MISVGHTVTYTLVLYLYLIYNIVSAMSIAPRPFWRKKISKDKKIVNNSLHIIDNKNYFSIVPKKLTKLYTYILNLFSLKIV